MASLDAGDEGTAIDSVVLHVEVGEEAVANEEFWRTPAKGADFGGGEGLLKAIVGVFDDVRVEFDTVVGAGVAWKREEYIDLGYSRVGQVWLGD